MDVQPFSPLLQSTNESITPSTAYGRPALFFALSQSGDSVFDASDQLMDFLTQTSEYSFLRFFHVHLVVFFAPNHSRTHFLTRSITAVTSHALLLCLSLDSPSHKVDRYFLDILYFRQLLRFDVVVSIVLETSLTTGWRQYTP